MSVDHLSKDFVIRGKKLGEKSKLLHALSDVSFDIYEGETLGIIGESGCGKSTLGRCLVKLHKPSAGTITYNGKDFWNLPVYEREAARRDIQMIFQDPYSSLDPRKTASYSIEEAMKVHHIGDTARERRQKALEYLQEVGLDIQHMERYPHEFSGGQRQRVNIARALSMEPKIIVCDEPVSALDVSIQAQVINLFRRLQKQFNLTYVFISHDLGIIKYISDRIMIMYLGRVMEFYTSEGIYADPKHPYYTQQHGSVGARTVQNGAAQNQTPSAPVSVQVLTRLSVQARRLTVVGGILSLIFGFTSVSAILGGYVS